MVLFQNKIIYMPFLPPNARSDTIEEYEAWCGGVKWSEKHIRSEDGIDIALAVTEVGLEKKEVGEKVGHEKVVLYFQGENSRSLIAQISKSQSIYFIYSFPKLVVFSCSFLSRQRLLPTASSS